MRPYSRGREVWAPSALYQSSQIFIVWTKIIAVDPEVLILSSWGSHYSQRKTTNKTDSRGQPRWLSGLAPPSAQGVILETRDRVPRRAPCMEPASPSACVSASLSLSVFLMNK